MKFKALLSAILIPFALSAQWTKTAGPVETSATTVEIAGSHLYLGTNGNGLFTSIDSGANWTNVAAYPDTAVQKNISSIVYHYNPFAFAYILYVATPTRIYTSTDNGASFQYGDAGLPDTLQGYNLYQANSTIYATAQLVDPITFNTLTRLYYYDDYNTQWQPVNNIPAGYPVTSVAALHDTLYCAVFGHGIYTTETNGFLWDSLTVGNGLLGSNNMRLLTTDGQKLYAIAYDNGPVLYITNNGLSFTSVSLSFTGGNTITTIAVHNGTICLGSPGATYISKDNGANWSTTALPYYSINEAKFLGGKIIAADPGNGFLYTPDDSNWHTSNTGLNYSTTNHLAYPYSSLYAMDGYNTFHTANQGGAWSEDTDRLFNMSAIARMGNKLIGFSKYGQNDLYSYDQGHSWGFENTAGAGILVNKYIVDNTNRQIFVWGQADVRRSDDYGATWKSFFYADANSQHDTLFTSMAKIKNRLFLTYTDQTAKMLYSDDSGNHWQQFVSTDSIYHVEAVDSVLLISTGSGVKKSTDMGATFTTVFGGDLFETYVNGKTIFNYKGPYANSIQYSTDYGATWTDISPNSDSIGAVNDIIMDATYLYAATSNHSVWKRSLSDIGITYVPDTSNNYQINNVGVNLLANNEKPAVSVYPNPFTNNFTVSVTTTATHYIDVKLYDITGRCIQVLAQNTYRPGVHTYSVNTAIPAGIYYVTTIVNGSMITKKVVRN